jgi:serine-type D-Ala-D-Ala carboxypeptidase
MCFRKRVYAGFIVAAVIQFAAANRSVAEDDAGKKSKYDFAPVARVLEAAVADGAFPGCAATVGNADGPFWTQAFGNLSAEVARDKRIAVTADTIYDLASLTKILGATSVVACLIRDGKMKLDDPLEKYVREFVIFGPEEQQATRRTVTIKHLLTHSSGLPAGRPLWKDGRTYADIVAAAAKVPLEAKPGEKTVYSDLGFILLGEAARRVGDKPLAELEQSLVFAPLGMKQTRRRPGIELLPRIAPTERVAGTDPDHPMFFRGVVHDENARAGEGLTGHAGLFSTAADVGRYGQEWLRALSGKSEVFPRELAVAFTARAEIPAGSSRALGWDTPSGRSSSGRKMPKAFGHTGFTGTSIWIDPERGIYLVLLSNRVHPTRASQKIAQVRRDFADNVAEAIPPITAK